MHLDFSQNIDPSSLSPKNIFEEKVILFLKEWESDALTVCVKTSGSTGAPKVFKIEKERMRHSAKMTCDFLGLEKGNTALLCLPIEYISGKMMLVRAMESGLKLIVSEPSSKPLEYINEAIDFCAMTPLQVQNSLEKLHLIENLIIGGAALSVNLKSQISNLKSQIYETYGMSETLSHIALKQISPKQEDFFTVLDGVEIAVDERNCLRIFAPKLNAELLQTNDIVELKNEKEFKFLGRYDNVINSGGIKIFAEELENETKAQLAMYGLDYDLVFLGISDEILGEKLVLVIEDSGGAKDVQSEQSRRLKSEILNLKFPSKFHIPKEILFLEVFPRSENGKVLRKEILKRI